MGLGLLGLAAASTAGVSPVSSASSRSAAAAVEPSVASTEPPGSTHAPGKVRIARGRRVSNMHRRSGSTTRATAARRGDGDCGRLALAGHGIAPCASCWWPRVSKAAPTGGVALSSGQTSAQSSSPPSRRSGQTFASRLSRNRTAIFAAPMVLSNDSCDAPRWCTTHAFGARDAQAAP